VLLCRAPSAVVVRQVCSWGYVYVENLTWVLMAPNNTILRLPHTFTNKSHISILIFRREGVRHMARALVCARKGVFWG
jgi:hypothetical protein